MSYDGGISVKINNPKLKAALKEFESYGLFIECFNEKEKYDFSFENWDSATIKGCPKDLDDLKDYIWQLIEVVNENENKEVLFQCKKMCKKLFRFAYTDIKDSFTYVYWAYSPDDITRASEHLDDMEFTYEKPGRKKASKKKNNGPSTLKEIFPGIDMTKPTGFVIDDDGYCIGFDRERHAEFLGEDNCLFITKDVKAIEEYQEIDNEIFDLLTMYDKCVVTTDLEDFGEYYNCGGFHLFYIIDAKTNKVVYSSEEDEFCSDCCGVPMDAEEELEEVLCKYTKLGE